MKNISSLVILLIVSWYANGSDKQTDDIISRERERLNAQGYQEIIPELRAVSVGSRPMQRAPRNEGHAAAEQHRGNQGGNNGRSQKIVPVLVRRNVGSRPLLRQPVLRSPEAE